MVQGRTIPVFAATLPATAGPPRSSARARASPRAGARSGPRAGTSRPARLPLRGLLRPAGGALRRLVLLFLLPALPAAARGEAGLERLHQVDDLRLRRLLRRGDDVLAFDLALDLLEDAGAHFVVVQLWLELLRRGLLDELHGELQLLVLHLALAQRHLGEWPDLVRVVELLHRQPVLAH